MRIKTMLFDVENIALRDKDAKRLRLEDGGEPVMILALCKWIGITDLSLYEMTAQVRNGG